MLNTRLSSKATPGQIKQHNEALILREIYARATISRAQLARLTHLSRPAVTELTQGLLEKGLICDAGPEKTFDKVGKKAQLLAFNPDAYQIVAVAVTNSAVICTLFNLRANAVARRSVQRSGATGDEVARLIMETIGQIIQHATRPLLGIAVGTPGVVDSQAGLVHMAASLGWQNLPLGQILQNRFRLPAFIGNDSNFAAVGEYRFGLGQGVKDLVLVEAGEGFGIGILSDGRIIQGSTHAAGELGHTPFPPLDDVCVCGRRGCLETKVSWWAIKRNVQRIAEEHPDSTVARLVNGGPVTDGVIWQALDQGDPHLTALVEQVATYLAQALMMVIHVLNPQRIIITGRILELGDLLVQHVQRTIRDYALPYISNEIEIVAIPSDDRSILLGACAFVLEHELGL
jgi:predicted NBD/HSP70 family sugar kinase